MIVSFLRILFVVPFTVFMTAVILLVMVFHQSERVFHKLAKFHARVTLATCGVTLAVRGLEHLDFSRSYIYVSNHASFFDIPAALAGIPNEIRIIYKKELERIPIFGWGLKFGKTYIAIDRKSGVDALESLEEAAEKIRTGASVLLFPEGTRTLDGQLQPFKRGAFNLAVRVGIPVVPVTIKGSYSILPRHSWRIRPGIIEVILDDPIYPPAANGKGAELQLRDAVRKKIEDHFIEL